MDDLSVLAQKALDASGVSHADLYLRRQRRNVARFSRNVLDQHAEHDEPQATARAGIRTNSGWQTAEVTTADLSPKSLVGALRLANSLAARAPVRDDFQGFAGPSAAPEHPNRVARSTLDATADDRATRVGAILALARAAKVTAAGLLEASSTEIAVANTEGLARFAASTLASCRVFALDADGVSGFAQHTHRDLDTLDAESLARHAISRCLEGKDPVALDAGDYDVVLEPPAVTELLEWMGFTTFGARGVEDGTSALAGRFGQRITGPKVTVVDDVTDPSPDAFGLPFDREGTSRARVVLIDAGVARACVTDRAHAARMGTESSGHACPPGGDGAPAPTAVEMAGGDDTLESLQSRVLRGLYIARFHYVNGLLDTRRALMTGMTRDGTFLIERGERTRGVRNLRFTDSVLEAFARIDGLSRLRAAVPTWWNDAGAFIAPAVLIRGLRFTGGASLR